MEQLTDSTTITQDKVRNFVIAGHGDLNKVITMLAEQPALLNMAYDWNPNDHETALQAAVQSGSTRIAEYLLAEGAVLDICTAAMLGRMQAVQQFLVADPALVKAVGAHGIPILSLAAWSGNLDLLKLLAEHGAKDGATSALFNATTRGNVDVMRWLLVSFKPNLTEKNFQGKTALALAGERQQEAIAVLLRQYGAIE